MKHINITNWQGNITDWTKFNYIYGGLDETIADKVNLSIPGTNLRNYFRKSNNLIHFEDREVTSQGFTCSYKNDVITISGTARSSGNIFLPYLENVATVTAGVHRLTLFIDTPDSSIKLFVGHNQSIYDEEPTFRGVSCDNTKVTVRKNFTVGGTINMMPYITAVQGTTYNITIRPMITVGEEIPTTYEPYGSMVLVENVGKIDLGSLSWFRNEGLFITNLKDIKPAPDSSTIGNIFCAIYESVSWGNVKRIDKSICVISTAPQIRVNDTSYSTAEAFKTAMNGVYLTYELATPKVTVFNQVDLGSLIWNYTSAGSLARFWTDNLQTIAKTPSASWEKGNISTPGYTNHSWNEFTGNGLDMDSAIRDDGVVGYRNLQYTTVQAFKTAMNGVILIYEAKDTPSANTLSMVKPSDSAPTAIEDSMSLDELLEPANEER